MLHQFIILCLFAWLFVALAMAITWAVAVKIANFSIVDIVWTLTFAPVAIFYASCAPGWQARRWLICGLVVIWSLRLGIHVALRVIRAHPKDDPRYLEFRNRWKENLGLKMFIFFQIQGLSVAALSLPFLIVGFNSALAVNGWEWAGAILWLLAVIGESTADHQLKTFKANQANVGEVCKIGLWHYSRHPNYFFRVVGLGCLLDFRRGLALGLHRNLLSGIDALFLLRVTGIPLTERQSFKSKGDKFRRYQQTTSMFVPWFPKRDAN